LVERGVPQGWSLSCVLFNLVIDPLLRLLNKNTPRLFQSAFADDLSFHHQCYHMLPIVQRCINEYGGSVGLSVNEKKCAVMALGDQHPTNSIWNAPTVTEYKYLGVLLGRQVTKERVFKDAFNKLADRTKLFSKIQVNPTTKILLAKLSCTPNIIPPQLLLSSTTPREPLHVSNPKIHLPLWKYQQETSLCRAKCLFQPKP
jgi:hypothetical protein